jgi:hypothetical protein
MDYRIALKPHSGGTGGEKSRRDITKEKIGYVRDDNTFINKLSFF